MPSKNLEVMEELRSESVVHRFSILHGLVISDDLKESRIPSTETPILKRYDIFFARFTSLHLLQVCREPVEEYIPQ